MGRAFLYPADPSMDPPSPLETMLEGGRSTSGKLRRMSQMGEIPWPLRGNWIGAPQIDVRAGDGPLRVGFFGNSFMERTVSQFVRQNPTAVVKSCIGTYSPPSHALGCYRRAQSELSVDFAVLGVLASTWPVSRSFSNSTFRFTNPEAYTYPIYETDADGRLVEIQPLVQTREALTRRFEDADYNRQWLEQLNTHDRTYNSFVYDESILDNSVLVRLVRRAYANRMQRNVESSYRGPVSFDPLWRDIVRTFAAEVRAAGGVPIVALFHDFGFADDLFHALRPVLDAERIAFVSTHTLFNANDKRTFGTDDHYTKANDAAVAAAISSIIADVNRIGQN
jgi:hypothetical protein